MFSWLRLLKTIAALTALLVVIGAQNLLSAKNQPARPILPPPLPTSMPKSWWRREVPPPLTYFAAALLIGLSGAYVWLSSRLDWNGAPLAAAGYLCLGAVWLVARTARTGYGVRENLVRLFGGLLGVVIGLATFLVGFKVEGALWSVTAIPESLVIGSSLVTVVLPTAIEAVALFWAAPYDKVRTSSDLQHRP